MAIKCPQCSYENPEHNAFCENCGLRLPSPSEAGSVLPSAGTLAGAPGNLAAQGVASGQSELFPQVGAVSEPVVPETTPADSGTRNRLPLLVIALIGAFVVLIGFIALGVLLLLSGVEEMGTSTVSDLSSESLQGFVPQLTAETATIEGETISSDTDTVTLVLPDDSEWSVMGTEDGYVHLEHPLGFLTVGVQHSFQPTTPDALMEAEISWMQTDFPDAEVVAGPEYWQLENGSGVTFALYYEESEFLGVESYNVDVYAIGTDADGMTTLWINFYVWEEDWEEFHEAVRPVFDSIRSPHFE
jgi:hypothetical protein